jgi:alkylated DNA repair dioxygenase AlkB
MELPPGLIYQPGFLAPAEERSTIELLEELGFTTVEMRGQVARRTVHHFGLRYDYTARSLESGDPIPEPLAELGRRCARLAGVDEDGFVQLLAQRYPPGAPIGWHRDSPPFGVIAGVSLAAACRMRFRRFGDERNVVEQLLEPGSAYVLAGEVRDRWQHQIPPVKELRYSLTFRTLRGKAAQAAASSETSPRTAVSAPGSSE